MDAIKITVYPDDVLQIDALKAMMKAFKIKFEISKSKPYNPEFVEKIKQGDVDFTKGKGKAISLDQLDSLWK